MADHTAEEAASFKGRIASITKFYYGYSQKRLPVQPLCVIIFLMRTSVSVLHTYTREGYQKKEDYEEHERERSVLKEKAVPDVLLRVVEAKRLLDSGKTDSVQDATEQVGISRSSFYKYKDDIFPFHETAKGKTITMVIQLDDEPGLLSIVLKTVAEFHANILTIHQSIPINGIASLTLSVDVLPETGDVTQMVASIEEQTGIHYVKILGRE